MRLTLYSDFSLRLLMYAALKDGALVTVQDVAKAYGISRNHLMKVTLELGHHGFIETVRGRNGGFRLARPPGEIILGDVIRATEDHFNLVECFDPATNTCPILGACRLKGILSQALSSYLAVLDGYTLADLGKNRGALARALALV